MNIEEFDFSVNLLIAILWQYNEAGKLQSLLTSKQTWYDNNQSQFWHDWYTNVFNLNTVNDFGAAVWSIILNISLSFGQNPDPPGKAIFGFGAFNKNFNHGNFAKNGTAINLTIEEKRFILKLRYWQLVAGGDIPSSNDFLKYAFRDYGDVYLLDGLNMTIVLVFTFIPSAKLKLILDHYDILPRPSGVQLNYVVLPRPVWGFGRFNKNFNHGNFKTGFFNDD